ncbi:CRISPR-associated endonuclease/helicase Cas3 [Methanosarcinales archaeon]|uniref:CRISPR-associated helicase/endonuclease Cas3 n=1 Tax=Candidatus Methanoperedens sp. BLZ2 TaxID=2035255 RepID=UPI000BE3A094|nr:CRISPR-associated helicase/endonuclease Cas3 [Candidatus Methanoperedens sp. BLZ2]KAB2946075.1 MAG: CRISPR-associated helicase/endonuclease Cas3 [Candidatus Methanoperedens sp.]MBZ0175017.1 CRISPR-associated helicase/endonuclease Cas3 [Candidatus Methanoperedens nitroreducens]CAG0956525.1 CRISPR-associated endonuclease/helicase Cas3 [Methanosarcinales archaeon]MCX9076636.1 CRISPR-associated helicase/endonuclease Cas3 [Candidatus Methanoperedens sp.]MCX9089431.1 CRISPR-associated helicase/en
MNKIQVYYQYWGKAEEPVETAHHLFPYHCLDVAAVANQWWAHSSSIRRSFTQETGIEEKQIHAWVMFFIALHDFGKLDIRFQMKVPELAKWNYGGELPKNSQSKNYYHGEQGYTWLVQESASYFEGVEDKPKRWLQNWFASTAGHHGEIPTNAEDNPPAFVPPSIKKQDIDARKEWVQDLYRLFLQPAGLNFEDIPTKEPPILLAGFCSICDWLGSNTHCFQPKNTIQPLKEYFNFISKENKALQVLHDFGLLTEVKNKGGMRDLYPNLIPINTQVLIDDLAVQQSMIIIEANTGSGKTEAALAYASKLLAQGLADSITFALPTQATANAMLERLEKVADKIFNGGKNVILAHGKRDYNDRFKKLIQQSQRTVNVQGEDEGGAQCSEWLSSSRKRAFLGQIAVTTVDQVMLSAIKSLQHYFVRSFGVGKSVLIIDEIHAYDAYMYGILEVVIKRQKQAGGSVILLSATLPAAQKQSLCKAWGVETGIEEQPYPLILQATDDEVKTFTLAEHEIGQDKIVNIELWQNDDCSITTEQLERIVQAAKKGAKIGIVCNLVDDAQRYAHSLSEMTSVSIPVDIFHSRYRYCDRMDKEKVVLGQYGIGRSNQGRILVGTQVIEQSLDIDFDWLISFICPVDLLFQRMGRLHRHKKERPEMNKKPLCTVVMHKNINLNTAETVKESYGLHGLIYKNIRALWRTQQLLQQHESIRFPDAYRDWIESVYKKDAWKDESESLTKLFEEYQMEQFASKYVSKGLTQENTYFRDTEGNAASLTREGEMNLSIIPVMEKNGKRCFLDGTDVPNANDKYNRELLSQNSLSVPNSWRAILPKSQHDIFYLPMQKRDEGWRFDYENGYLFYTQERGLQKVQKEKI